MNLEISRILLSIVAPQIVVIVWTRQLSLFRSYTYFEYSFPLSFPTPPSPPLHLPFFSPHIPGVFVTLFMMAYLISPRFCHRSVGYLEEEAVKTYTLCLEVRWSLVHL